MYVYVHNRRAKPGPGRSRTGGRPQAPAQPEAWGPCSVAAGRRCGSSSHPCPGAPLEISPAGSCWCGPPLVQPGSTPRNHMYMYIHVVCWLVAHSVARSAYSPPAYVCTVVHVHAELLFCTLDILYKQLTTNHRLLLICAPDLIIIMLQLCYLDSILHCKKVRVNYIYM